MNRRSAVAVGAVATLAAAVLIPALAHEGHGTTAGSTFDPNAPKKVSGATALAIGLKTAEVDFGQIEDVVRLTGVVRPMPDRIFATAPRYAGIIRSIAVQPGDVVVRGAALAEVESPEVAKSLFEVRRLESEYERLLSEGKRAESLVASLEIEGPAAVRSAELAEAEVERLVSAGEGVSANLLAQRQSEAVKLRADAGLKRVALNQARADVESLRRQAGTTQRSADALRAILPAAEGGTESAMEAGKPGLIRFLSPIDGVVISKQRVPGQGVEAGATILEVGDFARVQVEGEVPEGLVERLATAKNAPVRLRRGSDGQQVGQGTVRFISPVIDATKRTAHLIIEADNPGGAAGTLRPGQFVDVIVVLSRNESAVVVPGPAIVKEGPLQFVFVKEGKGENEVFKKRDVATGVRDDRVVEIRQGLVPGDVVAVGGAFSLSQLRGFVAGEAAPAAKPDSKGDGHDHTH
ncbi:MAG: efflux RND transporter periplasmic adaptor subunit [Phycisphaerales bacterium]|nr:efflux RND transporter periplasmic adaptor subunit [Phycisphaerales bacterium]